MKTIVFCNHLLAIPALQQMAEEEKLAGIVLPALEHEAVERAQMIAAEFDIPSITVERREIVPQLETWLQERKADVAFVLTFPYKIPPALLDIPASGFFNFHFGLLPGYRGPDPIFWQIRNRERSGGISVHRMDADIDTGPIAMIQEVPIDRWDTYGVHTGKLALAAVEAGRKMQELLAASGGNPELEEQDKTKGEYYRRPEFTDLTIDWKEGAEQIEAQIRASNPRYGGAIAFLRGSPFQILQAAVGSMGRPPEAPAGTIVTASSESLWVVCADKKLLRIDLLNTEAGFFTGGKVVDLFRIQQGEMFISSPDHQDEPQP